MDLNKTMQNLNKNGIETYYTDTKEGVVPKIKELIKSGDTVAVGGSMSLFECGVLELLRSGDYNFLDRYAEGVDTEQIFRSSYNADTYLCSSNAVTENGELYNVDGNSNRISSIAYGAKSVIMVVGINKIVQNLDEAIYRVKTIAAPKNCVRLNCDTYCNKTGKCKSLLLENPLMADGCSGDSRICCNYLVSAKQRHTGRIKIIFVGESVGY